MPSINAIVLAAGLSRRMNGPNKLLLPHGNTSVIKAVVTALEQCAVGILVVTGRDADLVQSEVAPHRTVFNPYFADGMGTSIAAGVKAQLNGDGYLIVLGDMPALDPAVVKTLIERADPGRIVVPIYAEEPDRGGHPVLFGSDFRAELLQLTGDSGARSILDAHLDLVERICVPGRLIDRDV